MKDHKSTDFPLNEALRLQPTQSLFIHNEGATGFSKSMTVFEITSIMPAQSDLDSKDLSDKLTSETKANLSKQRVFLKLNRSAWYSNNIEAKDDKDATVASLSTSFLSFSHWTLSFPAGSPHSSHALEMQPTGMGTRTDVFVQESVPYFWDIVSGAADRRIYKLLKVVDGKRVEVARFVSRHARDREGVLFLDGAMVDGVVAALTCVALLNRTDSFRK